MRYKILDILKKEGGFISGELISEKLGMTRAGVWNYMKSLKEEGYIIESIPRKGYRLVEGPDIVNYEEIKNYLNTKFIGKKIYHFEKIDSTNKEAKLIAGECEEGTVIIAEEQTEGKGRMGKKWESRNRKGIYMSIILKPDLEPIKISKITLVVSAAINNVLRSMGIDTSIKWPNDIYVEEKKVCGILTEMSAEINKVNYIVVGIGINVNLDEDDFGEDIKNIGTSLKIVEGKKLVRKEIVGNILNEVERLYIKFKNDDTKEAIETCRIYSSLIGREIKILRGKNTIIAKALDIGENGELIVEYDGREEKIFSGEVSVRKNN